MSYTELNGAILNHVTLLSHATLMSTPGERLTREEMITPETGCLGVRLLYGAYKDG